MGMKGDNVTWVDGLRGIGSFLVVITHLARVFDPDLFLPNSSEKAAPRILQWPIIRVFFQGRIGVSIFSLVTGYVCALKPIRQARNGHSEAALNGLAKSAFRRIPRIVLPVAIATSITWFICQLGVFRIAKFTDSAWLSTTAPEMVPNVHDALPALFWGISDTWLWGRNAYDANHWNLQPLLRSSLLVYVSVFATIGLQPRYRMMTSLAQWMYYYLGNDSFFGMQLSFGMFLVDLPNQICSQSSSVRLWSARVLSPLLLISGLILASYPETRPEWASWSTDLETLSHYLFPQGHDVPRFYTSLGLDLIALSIHLSPTFKDLLSNKNLLWLGKHSFAVFLIHGTLLRWVLAWCLFGIALPPREQNEKGEWHDGKLTMKGPLVRAFWVPLWFVLLYKLATLWTAYVDPFCARCTVALEEFVGIEDEKAGLPQ